jgi:hypothetical protein
VAIELPSGEVFEMDTDLFQPILPAECKFKVLKTKVEITLKKANGISWPSLEPSTDIKTFTTFGLVGTKGTVGGKEMHLATDAPLFALNR